MTISQGQLKEVLRYEAESGSFTWLLSRGRVKRGDQSGCKGKGGYIYIKLAGKRHAAHRLAWLYVHGVWPERDVDHVNGDTGDNRMCNLRLATKAQNQANSKFYKNNTSGVRGVFWDKKRSVWFSKIRSMGREIYLGKFDSRNEASLAYAAAAKKINGEFRRTE